MQDLLATRKHRALAAVLLLAVVGGINARYVAKVLDVLCLATILVSAWACGWRALDRNGGRFALELSVVLCAMLLCSPVSRKAHFVTLLIPFAAALSLWLRSERRGLAFAWVGIAALLLNGSAPALLGREGSLYALGYGTYFLGAWILWLGLVVHAWRGRREPAPGEPHHA